MINTNINICMKNYKYIKEKILTDDTTANVVEYMLSKAITEGISTTVNFIYKKHKIIKDKRRYYSIYRIHDGKKLYSKIKYQDMAKYIIDNLHNDAKIRNIIKLEEDVSRFKDKINFMKQQMTYFKDISRLEAKLTLTLDYYNRSKREFLTTLGKKNIC